MKEVTEAPGAASKFFYFLGNTLLAVGLQFLAENTIHLLHTSYLDVILLLNQLTGI
jgi:hypothetical protein